MLAENECQDASSDDLLGDLPPNLWDQVNDFNWLKAEHSPNWNVLRSEDQRAIDPEGWQVIIAGDESHLALDDLLRASKVVAEVMH